MEPVASLEAATLSHLKHICTCPYALAYVLLSSVFSYLRLFACQDGEESGDQPQDRSKQLRYTRGDMQQVLEERLQFKMRVDELEEELQLLRERSVMDGER